MEVNMTIGNPNDADRVEKVRVRQHGSSEYVEHIVEDSAAAQRSFTFQISGLLWLMFGALEGLLTLRLILKLLAANPANPFARLIYGLSDIFVWPFIGLTVTPSAAGIVVEIHTIIAMVVYAMIGWLVITLVRILLYRRTERSVHIEQRERLR
jgi:YggT family protein